MRTVVGCGIIASLIAGLCGAAPATAAPNGVTVMTRNLYLGSDLLPLATAFTPQDQAARAAEVFTQVKATDFASRARLLAAEISGSGAALVGLQEVALWRTGALDGARTPAKKVEFDFLELLLNELGDSYQVVVVEDLFDAEISSALGHDVRFTSRDAILVKRGSVIVTNRSKGRFGTFLTIPTISGPMLDRRGWTAVDVTASGRKFRFLNTHLDSTVSAIRVAQAAELNSGPAAVKVPVVLVGDLNSTPDGVAFPAYSMLRASGFADSWPAAVAGPTCCYASDLRGPASLNERIDYVLTRPALPVSDVYRTGIDPAKRTAAGLWPSDHAGVVATVRLPS